MVLEWGTMVVVNFASLTFARLKHRSVSRVPKGDLPSFHNWFIPKHSGKSLTSGFLVSATAPAMMAPSYGTVVWVGESIYLKICLENMVCPKPGSVQTNASKGSANMV